MDCIFCKIINKEIPSSVLYEDDDMIVFNDLEPQSPVHFLAVPKKHIASLNDLKKEDANLIGKIYLKIKDIAQEMNFANNGYRVVINCGKDGLQSVPHIHFHVMAGRKLQWPAG